MASAPSSSGEPPRAAPDPAGDGVVWHSTCGYADCVEPSRYAADSICKGCRRIKYCTFTCQKADWKRHKAACKRDEAADEAAAREGALVVRPRARPPPPKPGLRFDAAIDGNVKHVEALLQLGADVNAANTIGLTPMFAASQRGHVAVVLALLAAPNIAVNASCVVRDSHDSLAGMTPLHIAALFGHSSIVAALLAAPGVSVNATVKSSGTPLHIATSGGYEAIVTALLAHPAVDVNQRLDGRTPLLFARLNGHVRVAAILEAQGGVV